MQLPISTSQTAVIGAELASDLMRRSAEQRQIRWSCRSVLVRNLSALDTEWAVASSALVFSCGPSPMRLELVNSRLRPPAVTTDVWTERPETSIPTAFLSAFELSDIERDQLIRSVVSSEALEGVELSYDLVNRLVDQVMLEPPIKLG